MTTRFSQSTEFITLLNQCGDGLSELPRDSGAPPRSSDSRYKTISLGASAYRERRSASFRFIRSTAERSSSR